MPGPDLTGMTLDNSSIFPGRSPQKLSDKKLTEKVFLIFETEVLRLPLEEIAEDRSDNHHNGKVDDLLLGWGDEGSQDIGSNEKFKPENNFTGEFIPDLGIDVITFP